MEKEHVHKDRGKERVRKNGRERESYTRVLRCNAPVRWTPVETARPFLDRVVLFFILCQFVPYCSCLLSFSFSLRPSAYLLPFLRGFCLWWKGNHGALRVTGPVVFFSSREDQPPPPSTPIVVFSFRSLLPLFIVLSSYVLFAPNAALVRLRPLLLRLVMTKSCTSVNHHPPLPVFLR